MATTSYPAVGNDGDVNDAQHVQVHAIGDGIVEDFHVGGVSGASITLNNATNEVTLTDHRCRVAGYVGDSNGPVTVEIPAVVSTTTYTIAWCYDPSLNVADGGGGRSAEGPVRLVVEDGALDLAGGKRYTVLYTITRTAAQVLTASTRVDHRKWVGPNLTMPVYAAPTVAFPRGTQILESSTGCVWLRDLNDAGTALTWRNITSPPSIEFPASSGLVAVQDPAIILRSPGIVQLSGSLKRSNNAALSSGASVLLGFMPVGMRPSARKQFACAVNGSGSIDCARVIVYPDGGVWMFDPVATGTVTGIHLDNVIYRVAGV